MIFFCVGLNAKWITAFPCLESNILNCILNSDLDRCAATAGWGRKCTK